MWSYFRQDDVEIGVPGKMSRTRLRSHLHDVVQVMIVTDGSREVRLGSASVDVPRSSALIIPPAVVHKASAGQWTGFNAYLDPSHLPSTTARLLCFDSLPHWTANVGETRSNTQIGAILDFVSSGKITWEDPSIKPFDFACGDRSGWPSSREGRIRRYQREAGISPYAHIKAEQLSQARRKIAGGEDIASVAVDLGFSDQAHLGRQFKASFGTPPGQYFTGLLRDVTNIQDRSAKVL